jgi:hypothetical protein
MVEEGSLLEFKGHEMLLKNNSSPERKKKPVTVPGRL